MKMSVMSKASVTLASVCLLFSGCEHKELCYDHTHSADFEVRFKWDLAPDADPATMVVNFFTLDGRHVTSREFSSRHGGAVRIEAGEYRVLFHNGEMENVKESVDHYDRYGLFTTEESLLAPMSRTLSSPPRPTESSNEPVRKEAETVWAGKHEYVKIVSNSQDQVLELYPEEVTSRYTVEVVNVENLRDNLGLSAALSGLSAGYTISNGSASGKPVTIPFSVSRKNDTTIEARFLTFGHCPEKSGGVHILSIYTSNKIYYNFDVSEQVHNAPDERDVYIRIDGLKLPADGQLVSPSIDGWGEVENVDIKM